MQTLQYFMCTVHGEEHLNGNSVIMLVINLSQLHFSCIYLKLCIYAYMLHIFYIYSAYILHICCMYSAYSLHIFWIYLNGTSVIALAINWRHLHFKCIYLKLCIHAAYILHIFCIHSAYICIYSADIWNYA